MLTRVCSHLCEKIGHLVPNSVLYSAMMAMTTMMGELSAADALYSPTTHKILKIKKIKKSKNQLKKKIPNKHIETFILSCRILEHSCSSLSASYLLFVCLFVVAASLTVIPKQSLLEFYLDEFYFNESFSHLLIFRTISPFHTFTHSHSHIHIQSRPLFLSRFNFDYNGFVLHPMPCRG